MFKHSDKTAVILAADIGGSHITTGLVQAANLKLEEGSVRSAPVRAKHAAGKEILKDLGAAFSAALSLLNGRTLAGIAIAMPGPFLYDAGIFKIRGLDKFGALYGVDFKQFLQDHLPIDPGTPVLFKNDADCFALGAYRQYGNGETDRLIGVTLGTGLGSAFIEGGWVVDQGPLVPAQGNLFTEPLRITGTKPVNSYLSDRAVEGWQEVFRYGMAEDLISSRGILGYVNKQLSTAVGPEFRDVKAVASKAREDLSQGGAAMVCREAFEHFGLGLGSCLQPWVSAFQPATIVIGGGIARAADLFTADLRAALSDTKSVDLVFVQDQQMDALPLIGAAAALCGSAGCAKTGEESNSQAGNWRKTHQPVLPQTVEGILATLPATDNGPDDTTYQIYPWTPLGDRKIHAGFDALAGWMKEQITGRADKVIALDGYAGVDWRSLQANLSRALADIGLEPVWINMAAYSRDATEIEKMVRPFLGEDTSVWGKKASLQLSDFMDTAAITEQLTTERLNAMGGDVTIVLGTGAGLMNGAQPLIFVELPKNEIQYRLQAGVTGNLYTAERPVYAQMYKRAYFVDWPVLNDYRRQLDSAITIVADGQWADTIHWMSYKDLQNGFNRIARRPIRARPWFAPGAWGGDWMKAHIPQLSKREVNYAWSFELIVPENGLVLESDGLLLEVPFDWLMEYQSNNVLGRDARTFGSYFPIRFDFLDTYDGGNLSIQCHPSVAYIQEHFGETVTQDETYYMLDTAPGAGVYLGFQEDIEPASFKQVLIESQRDNKPIDIEKYVQLHPASKHDLFLIPNQTIHSSGKGSLVLEISATPYIFTFKMYDWVRPDLNGKPRPINIEHGFQNLNFSRKGKQVEKELISHPVLLESTDAIQRWDLPTHKDHYYSIHRLEIKSSTREYTDNQCHIMMVVEGNSVDVIPESGGQFRYHYAETFVIPASVGNYQLVSPTGQPVKVIKAFVK